MLIGPYHSAENEKRKQTRPAPNFQAMERGNARAGSYIVAALRLPLPVGSRMFSAAQGATEFILTRLGFDRSAPDAAAKSGDMNAGTVLRAELHSLNV